MSTHPQTEKQAPMSSEMIGERVTELLSLTERLTALLRKENSLLTKQRPSELKSLIEEKNRLSALYQREMRILRSHKSQLADISLSARQALQSATDGFRQAVERNQRLIERVKSVSDGLIGAVCEEVDKRNNPVRSYGPNARVEAGHRPPTTLALDSRI